MDYAIELTNKIFLRADDGSFYYFTVRQEHINGDWYNLVIKKAPQKYRAKFKFELIDSIPNLVIDTNKYPILSWDKQDYKITFSVEGLNGATILFRETDL